MDRIYGQIAKGLEEQFVQRFGAVGEQFDPQQHECMAMLNTEYQKQEHTIAQVLQQGYRIDDVVVRPAKVTVFEYHH